MTMLLALDVGNTQTVIGIFEDGKTLKEHWRLETKKERTSDELGILIKELLKFSNIPLEAVTGIITSNVVPPMQRALEDMSKRYFGITPLAVHADLKMNITIALPNPEEVGADRIVNAVAAYARYPSDLIVVDFGTATTFDFIDRDGHYQGGAICPGPQIAANALFHNASKLPRVDIREPRQVLGRTTVESIQSGIFYGYLSLVDGLVTRLRTEQAPHARVIATGGLASVIAPASATIEKHDEFLTLEGLSLLYQWNS